jgi:hypothetical protein
MTRARVPRARSESGREDDASGGESDLSFIPEELASRCDKLIRVYHAMPGTPRLADLIWHSEARTFIETHPALNQILMGSAKVKSAKRTNELLRMIAKIILAMEILCDNFADWGTRFPDAKQRAEAILSATAFKSRLWLMDHYLYHESRDARRDVVRILEPP